MTDPTTLPLTLECDADVDVVRDVPFAAGTFDLYRPTTPGPHPVVVLVLGYPDWGMRQFFGKSFKDWTFVADWARHFAAAGVAAVAYTNSAPLEDLQALLEHLRARGDLAIDGTRIGLWACSGHGPTALSALASVRAAALVYAFPIDVDGSDVADASKQFYFALPALTLGDLPATPLLVVRAGADATPGLNVALDRFVAAARHLPLEVMELPDMPHAFELMVDDARSHAAVRDVVAWLRARLA